MLISVLNDYADKTGLSVEYSSVEYYDSMQECIRAVDKGKADIVAGDRSCILEMYVNQEKNTVQSY